MNFGTFLLMQSPSARPSQEIYARGLDLAQTAEGLGFRNVWLAEHHIRDLVGITHFNCSFWFGDLEHARVLRSMELFAKEVMPAVA